MLRGMQPGKQIREHTEMLVNMSGSQIPDKSDTSGLPRDKKQQVDGAVLAHGELFSGLAAVDSWCELGQVT